MSNPINKPWKDRQRARKNEDGREKVRNHLDAGKRHKIRKCFANKDFLNSFNVSGPIFFVHALTLENCRFSSEDDAVGQFGREIESASPPLGCYQWWNFIWAQSLNVSFWSI